MSEQEQERPLVEMLDEEELDLDLDGDELFGHSPRSSTPSRSARKSVSAPKPPLAQEEEEEEEVPDDEPPQEEEPMTTKRKQPDPATPEIREAREAVVGAGDVGTLRVKVYEPSTDLRSGDKLLVDLGTITPDDFLSIEQLIVEQAGGSPQYDTPVVIHSFVVKADGTTFNKKPNIARRVLRGYDGPDPNKKATLFGTPRNGADTKKDNGSMWGSGSSMNFQEMLMFKMFGGGGSSSRTNGADPEVKAKLDEMGAALREAKDRETRAELERIKAEAKAEQERQAAAHKAEMDKLAAKLDKLVEGTTKKDDGALAAAITAAATTVATVLTTVVKSGSDRMTMQLEQAKLDNERAIAQINDSRKASEQQMALVLQVFQNSKDTTSEKVIADMHRMFAETNTSNARTSAHLISMLAEAYGMQDRGVWRDLLDQVVGVGAQIAAKHFDVDLADDEDEDEGSDTSVQQIQDNPGKQLPDKVSGDEESDAAPAKSATPLKDVAEEDDYLSHLAACIRERNDEQAATTIFQWMAAMGLAIKEGEMEPNEYTEGFNTDPKETARIIMVHMGSAAEFAEAVAAHTEIIYKKALAHVQKQEAKKAAGQSASTEAAEDPDDDGDPLGGSAEVEEAPSPPKKKTSKKAPRRKAAPKKARPAPQE